MDDAGRDLEERLEALEQLAAKVIAFARQHPAGRAILKRLGISP